jgi:hypothetical protein
MIHFSAFYRLSTSLVNNGMDHPTKFPNGELILSLVPQLVIAPFGLDEVLLLHFLTNGTSHF